MSSHQYNNMGFIPPAPALVISLKNKYLNREEQNVLFLIDTGTDASCIPKGMATKLGLQAHDFVTAKDFDNISHGSKPIYHADFHIDTFTFNDVEVDEIDHDFGLIGRDILNQLKVILDGRGLFFTIQ